MTIGSSQLLVLVIYTDPVKSYHPHFADYKIANTLNRFRFETYKVLDQDGELLAADKNIIALLMLTVLLAIKNEINGNDETLLASKILLVKNLKNRNLDKDTEANILTFIRLYACFANPEMNHKFEQQTQLIISKTKTMGIIEYAIYEAAEEAKVRGLAEGMEQGALKSRLFTAEKMLSKGISIDDIQEYTDLTEAQILQIAERQGIFIS